MNNPIQAIESLVRRLSSVEERMATLKEQGEGLRKKLFAALEDGADKAETVYGRVNLKEQKVYDYSGSPEVALALEALEVAKAQLKAAEKAAQAKASFTVKRTLVFTRNKAVSARAKSGRIYVRSFLRRRKAAVAAAVSAA